MLPTYADRESKDRRYYLQGGDEARMDVRHCMRDMKVIESAMMKKRMSRPQQRDTSNLSPPPLDQYSYAVESSMHESIMETVQNCSMTTLYIQSFVVCT